MLDIEFGSKDILNCFRGCLYQEDFQKLLEIVDSRLDEINNYSYIYYMLNYNFYNNEKKILRNIRDQILVSLGKFDDVKDIDDEKVNFEEDDEGQEDQGNDEDDEDDEDQEDQDQENEEVDDQGNDNDEDQGNDEDEDQGNNQEIESKISNYFNLIVNEHPDYIPTEGKFERLALYNSLERYSEEFSQVWVKRKNEKRNLYASCKQCKKHKHELDDDNYCYSCNSYLDNSKIYQKGQKIFKNKICVGLYIYYSLDGVKNKNMKTFIQKKKSEIFSYSSKIIGDSTVFRLPESSFYDSESYPGITLEKYCKTVNKITFEEISKYDNVIYSFGTNDLGNGFSEDHIIENLELLAEGKNKTIFIMPEKDSYQLYKKCIERFNDDKYGIVTTFMDRDIEESEENLFKILIEDINYEIFLKVEN